MWFDGLLVLNPYEAISIRTGSGRIMKGNPHKKYTFEDKFDRKYACWVKNSPKVWAWYKQKNRKKFRRILKKENGDDQ